MNELQIFKNKEFGKLTVIEKDGEPWFVGSEVSAILGYRNIKSAISKHCKYVKIFKVSDLETFDLPFKIPSRGRAFINEKDIYRLIMKSELPSAERFQDWVTDEVLPTIRKTGGYLHSEIDWSDLNNIQRVLDVAKEERQKRLKAEKTIQRQKPKVKYYNNVLDTNSCFTTTQIAKELEMTAYQLNLILQQENIQYKQSGQWLLKKEYQDKGYVKTRTYVINKDNKKKETSHSTVWTEKGREFIIDLMEKI